MQFALVGSSSSLHSEVCKALGGSSGVVRSIISACCSSRERGCIMPLRNYTLFQNCKKCYSLRSILIRRLYSNRVTNVVLPLVCCDNNDKLFLTRWWTCRSADSNSDICQATKASTTTNQKLESTSTERSTRATPTHFCILRLHHPRWCSDALCNLAIAISSLQCARIITFIFSGPVA